MVLRKNKKNKPRRHSFKTKRTVSLIPNIMTVTALCAGLSSIRFAITGKWEMAVASIFVAAIFDMLDGRVARYLGSASNFGAELDSLSDLVSFGVAPALLIYLHSLHEWRGIGWTICLFFVVCGALRLARFNTTLAQDSPLSGNFFTGVPITIGATLSMIPLMIDFVAGEKWVAQPLVHGIGLTLIGLLMISRLPTLSLKKMQVSQRWSLPLLVSVAILGTAVVNEPWATLVFLGSLYILLLPVGAWKASQILKRHPKISKKEIDLGQN